MLDHTHGPVCAVFNLDKKSGDLGFDLKIVADKRYKKRMSELFQDIACSTRGMKREMQDVEQQFGFVVCQFRLESRHFEGIVAMLANLKLIRDDQIELMARRHKPTLH